MSQESEYFPKNGVGMIAVNDATLLQSLIFDLLGRQFENVPFYRELIALFNEAFRITAYGQCLDVLTEKDSKMIVNNNTGVNVGLLTEERYNTIVKYKTSFYSFVLPVRLAMYAADIVERQLHDDVERILLLVGHVFQVQDDYLDCFADALVLGKIGTDIRDGKCSWLIINALSLTKNDGHCLDVLTQNYGVDDALAQRRIKDVYNRIHITKHYNTIVNELVADIFREIDRFNDLYVGRLPKEFFYQSLAQIYKRQK